MREPPLERPQKPAQCIFFKGTEAGGGTLRPAEPPRDFLLYLFIIYYVFIEYGARHPADSSRHVRAAVPGKTFFLTCGGRQGGGGGSESADAERALLSSAGVLFRSLRAEVARVSEQEGGSGQQELLQRRLRLVLPAAVRM